jgi:antitoxin component of MazEF toxin-antitoxin module
MKKIINGKEVLRRVIKQGDSLVVTIPPEIIERLSIRRGDQVVITSDDETVTYRKYRGVVHDYNV